MSTTRPSRSFDTAVGNTITGPGFPIASARDDIVIIPQGGGGSGSFWESKSKLWPLPPEGPLTLAADWPSEGIAKGSAVIDGTELRQLAAEATRLNLPEILELRVDRRTYVR